MQKAQQKGRYLDPLQCGNWEFEVVDGNRVFVVRLDNHSCERGIWAVSGIAFKHALACISKKTESVETYVHHCLKKPSYLKTYCHLIHPIPDEHIWPQMKFETVLPPLKSRKAGRQKKQRRRGENEPRKMQRLVGFRCSKCCQHFCTYIKHRRSKKKKRRLEAVVQMLVHQGGIKPQRKQ
ncbi:hypothetical protein ACOSQ4_019872 [Xanthoceras sorbifolium]